MINQSEKKMVDDEHVMFYFSFFEPKKTTRSKYQFFFLQAKAKKMFHVEV